LLHKPPCIICLYVYCLSYVEDNWCSPHVALVKWRRIYTGCFIMFSVITNIYNKKTKGPTLMELFTATGRLKKVFGNYRRSMCVPRVTRHTSIRYLIPCYTHVNMGATIFFTAAIMRAFSSARSRVNGGTYSRPHQCNVTSLTLGS
jgi:hypothetical protein